MHATKNNKFSFNLNTNINPSILRENAQIETDEGVITLHQCTGRETAFHPHIAEYWRCTFSCGYSCGVTFYYSV